MGYRARMDVTNRAEADEPLPDSLVVRRAVREDTAAICDLLAEVCPANPKADAAVLAWQYWDNPYGTTSSWVAEEEGRVLAHYAASPVPGRLDGEPAVLASGADAATRREARGRACFPASQPPRGKGRGRRAAGWCSPHPPPARWLPP
jgi:Acetyltransferase (GNAT) domain